MGNEEEKEGIEYKKFIENMKAEDVLEFLYNRVEEWGKERNPVEKVKEDIKLMIATLKEDKFEKMQVHFRLM